MTKPRKYGGKSHPGMPTEEQTRPISTETSNLVDKNTLFWYLLQRRALKRQKLQVDDQTAQIWWKISSWDANSGANETNIDGTSNLVEKNTLFLISPAKTSLEKTKDANWWPNRDANSAADETNDDGN